MPEALASGAVLRRSQFRQVLDGGAELLRERFPADEPVEDLVRDRAPRSSIWCCAPPGCSTPAASPRISALVAVGGYGRGELHPSSDIDIMVLLPKSDSADWQSDIERFLTFLWDIGLEVGHSVRSDRRLPAREPRRHQRRDDAVRGAPARRTASRCSPACAARSRRTGSGPSQDFFEAKVKEQTERHHRYFDTAYNLEPNVKSSPGGLRDIQTIGWVAKRHFGTDTLDELVPHGFLTREELRKLKAGQSFLWKVRFGLHVLTGRREDRLLFDYQIKLAKTLRLRGCELHARGRAAHAEVLPHRHGREPAERDAAAAVSRGDTDRRARRRIPINARFQIRNDYLEVTPSRGVRALPLGAARAVRAAAAASRSCAACAPRPSALIGAHVSLIDEEFRQNPRHHRLFMEILCAPVGVTHELRRMNLYGVLGRYIPAFGRVVGRMQYDLFHAYTVDAHTLFVVSNLRRFAMPKYNHEFPDAEPDHAVRCRARSSPTWPRCFTTSPRAAAAIIPSSARSTPRRSAWSRVSAATRRAWWPGWCATT